MIIFFYDWIKYSNYKDDRLGNIGNNEFFFKKILARKTKSKKSKPLEQHNPKYQIFAQEILLSKNPNLSVWLYANFHPVQNYQLEMEKYIYMYKKGKIKQKEFLISMLYLRMQRCMFRFELKAIQIYFIIKNLQQVLA